MPKEPLTPWKFVRVVVLKHLPYGLAVRLEEGGQRGIIRMREISWERAERMQFMERFPEGTSAEAVILKVEPDGHIELSLRLAEYDPWENILDHYKPEQIVEGVVTGVKSYGAFVEIEQGLTGLLHNSRLPAWEKKREPLTLFWPGDHVRVKISKIDSEKRRVDLSMDGILHSLRPGVASNSPAIENSPPRNPLADPLALQKLVGQRSQSILLVEDDKEQAKLIDSWLTKLNQRITRVETAEEGLEIVQREDLDIAIIDFGLPGMSGLEMIYLLVKSYPKIKCFLATDWARIQEHLSEIEALQSLGVGVLIKPIMPEDLVDALLGIGKEESMSVKDQKAFPPINLALPDLDSNASLEALLPTLDKCRRATQFDYAVLFSLDPTRRKIDIVAQTRDAALNLYAIGDLIHSPVRDVAEDGVTVSEENISPEIDNPRFRYLHTFCHFSACLGVHVPHTVHRQYALFLFSRSERAIRPDHINYVEATSIVFGVSLERKIFQDKAKALHKAALLGHMASSLVHEINHSLSLLDPRLETQASQLEEMAEKIRSGNAVTQADLLQATANMQEARQSLSTLYNMTRLFSIPFSQKKDEYIRIDELVNLSSLLLREITKRNKVPIHLISPQELTILRGQGSLLLQVLWNVLLNAIEQISAMRPGEGGEIQVRIERPASVRNSKKLRILVEDTGPGIHRRLWENIFEAGYSTRKDGSGLGLYVSQGIIQSLGGKLYVHESFILGGTTFAIEIPQRL